MANELKLFDNNRLADYLSMYHFPSVCGGHGYIATFVDGHSAPVLLHMYNKDGENYLQIEGDGRNDRRLQIRLIDYFAYRESEFYYMIYYRSKEDNDGNNKVWYKICQDDKEEG